MATNQIRFSNRMLFTLLLLTGFIFLFAPQRLTSKFQFAFARIFHWPLSIGRNISLAARTHQPVKQMLSRSESQYQNHISNLEEWLRQERLKVSMLAGLRDRFPLEGAKLVIAAVSMAPEGLGTELIIDRGQEDDLAVGQFVLGDNSIIGTISEVSARTARVVLISDPASKIAVKIGQLNINRVMQGDGNDSARIPLVSTGHKVSIGDKVFAHRKPGFLNDPMIIAEVAECKKDDENPSIWDITVKPVCDIERLNDVAVIVMNPKH